MSSRKKRKSKPGGRQFPGRKTIPSFASHTCGRLVGETLAASAAPTPPLPRRRQSSPAKGPAASREAAAGPLLQLNPLLARKERGNTQRRQPWRLEATATNSGKGAADLLPPHMIPTLPCSDLAKLQQMAGWRGRRGECGSERRRRRMAGGEAAWPALRYASRVLSERLAGRGHGGTGM